MKITVNRNELATALTWVKRSLPKRPNVPILAGMRVEVADGRLTLAAFDYDQTGRAFVAGDDAESGVILVTGAELAEVVRVLPKGKTVRAELSAIFPEPIPEPEQSHDYTESPDSEYPHLVWAECSCGEWKTSGAMGSQIALISHQKHAPAPIVQPMPTLTVRCDGTTSQLTGLPIDEYPALPEMPAVTGVIAADVFKRSITRVSAAAGRDDTLPSLTCLNMTASASTLALAATDRYRLAVDTIDWTPADLDQPEHSYLIPAQAVAEFAKKAAGKVSVHFGADAGNDAPGHGYGGATGGFAAFSDDTRQLIMRTCSGEFPRIRSIIRSKHATTVSVDSAALAAAVTACGAITEKHAAVVLAFADGTVTVQGMRDGNVAATRNVPAAMTGDDVTSGFNAVYLPSMLAGVTGEATLSFDGAAKPVQISAAGDTFTGLVMPIRLNG